MAAPSTPDTTEWRLPHEWREYREAMKARHLTAAQWLGLDPNKVIATSFKLEKDENYPETYAAVQWTSPEMLKPRSDVEAVLSLGVSSTCDDDPSYNVRAALHPNDGHALYLAIGAEPTPPEVFNPQDLATLTALHDQGADEVAQRAGVSVWDVSSNQVPPGTVAEILDANGNPTGQRVVFGERIPAAQAVKFAPEVRLTCTCPVIPPQPNAHFGGIDPQPGCPVHHYLTDHP
jgi:hypothetical protein